MFIYIDGFGQLEADKRIIIRISITCGETPFFSRPGEGETAASACCMLDKSVSMPRVITHMSASHKILVIAFQ